MDYEATDKFATHKAYAELGVGKYFPYWVGKHTLKIELVPFDGLHFRRLSGEIIPDYLLFDTEGEARRHMIKSMSYSKL